MVMAGPLTALLTYAVMFGVHLEHDFGEHSPEGYYRDDRDPEGYTGAYIRLV